VMCIIFLAETPKLWKVSDLTIEMKLWYNLHFVKFVSNKYIHHNAGEQPNFYSQTSPICISCVLEIGR